MVNHSVMNDSIQEQALIDLHDDHGPRQWHILGSGAMACLWAARISQYAASTPTLNWQDSPVILLLRTAADKARLRAQGGIIVHEHSVATQVPVLGAVRAEHDITIHKLLVCSKAQDTLTALASVQHLFAPDARIVLLQNGIRIHHDVVRQYTAEHVYSLSTSQGAYMHSRFNVVAAGFFDSFLGAHPNATASALEHGRSLLEVLPSQQMRINWDGNITQRLWRKFAINCAINALTVIYNCRNGELLKIPLARAQLEALCTEIQLILHATAPAFMLDELFTQVESVLNATAHNVSSTLQDARSGRSTEINEFNVYLCELAQYSGIQTPINTQIITNFYRSVTQLAH